MKILYKMIMLKEIIVGFLRIYYIIFNFILSLDRGKLFHFFTTLNAKKIFSDGKHGNKF